jgi:hypothetical protein
MPVDRKKAEDFVIEMYKGMDRMKLAIKARHEELIGHEPNVDHLARLCQDIWRLATFHLSALEYVHGDADDGHVPARYTAPEITGERSERLQAMDARLQLRWQAIARTEH